MLVGAFVAPRSLLIVSEKGNGHPVAPEPRCRCAGTAMALRRNRDAVAPERRWRCAGTAMPLRRNGHPVAPEPPRMQKPHSGGLFFFWVRRTSSLPLSRAWQASSFRLARLWERPIPQRAAREEPPSTFSAFSTRLINHMPPPVARGRRRIVPAAGGKFTPRNPLPTPPACDAI